MTHDDRTGAMTGFKYGQAAAGGEHAGHATAGAAADTAAKPAADPHAGHVTTTDSAKTTATATVHDSAMMEMHMRMLADPVIRERIMADTAMLRVMRASIDAMPAEHREHMRSLLREGTAAGEVQRTRIPISKESPRAATKQTATPTKTKAAAPAKTKVAPATMTKAKAPPTKKPADPHAGHKPPPES